jgi:replicative DNA helicase
MAGIDALFADEAEIIEEEVMDEDEGIPEEEMPRKSISGFGPVIVQKPDDLFDHESEMWDIIDAFEERAWSDQSVGIPTGWAQLDQGLGGGWKTGWTIVAGDSNIGKTSWLSNLAWNTAMNNRDKVFVADFSLDDPMHDKIPRIVAAANKVLINAVKTPLEYEQYPDMLKRREVGIKKLRDAVDCYRAYDANFSVNFEAIYNELKRLKVLLEEAGEGRRLIAFIDNFHDLETDAPEARGGDKEKFDYLAKRVSDMATELDIPVITTAEFKKINGFRRPSVDDIRESVKIKYEAKAILLCYNEVSLKGEAASIYYERTGNPAKQPVFEVKFGKNKFSSFKGRVFYEFYPDIAYFEESDPQTAKRYNNLIYSNE